MRWFGAGRVPETNPVRNDTVVGWTNEYGPGKTGSSRPRSVTITRPSRIPDIWISSPGAPVDLRKTDPEGQPVAGYGAGGH